MPLQSARASDAADVPGAEWWSCDSLLAQLLMQLTLVGAGHPATIILMNGVAADLFSSLPGLGFSGVETLAVGEAGTTAENNHSAGDTKS